MNNHILKLLFVLAVFSPSVASAQLGDFFSAVRDVARESLAPTRLGTRPINAEHLAGTYVYQEPVLVFETQSIASQLGAAMASGDIKTRLSAAYGRAGIAPQKLSLTFRQDGRFSATINGDTSDGTYTIAGPNITLSSAYGAAKVPVNLLQDGHELQMSVKPDKLAAFLQSLTLLNGTTQTAIASFSNTLKDYSGIQVGMTFRKQ